MKYLLDTDAFSEIAKQRNRPIAQRLTRTLWSDLGVSVITLGEVRSGALSNPSLPAGMLTRITALTQVVTVLSLNVDVVSHYASLRADLKRKGTPIGPNDMWLAAHALALDLTLVTGNAREYARVPTLRVENWTTP